jgi:hypothetical protein
MSGMFRPFAFDRDIRRLDGALAVVGGALALTTILFWLMPELSGRIVAPLVDVAINVAATLVGGAVSILAWVRWRETAGVGALYESGAFVVLTVTNSVLLGLVLIGRGDLFGLNPGEPGAASAYLWTSARLMAGALLVTGAVRGLRRTTPPQSPCSRSSRSGSTSRLHCCSDGCTSGSASHRTRSWLSASSSPPSASSISR